MRTLRTVTTVASCFVALAFSFSLPEPKRSENASAYPHGTTTCLEGSNGPGVELFLKQDSRCEGKVSYPHLEVDVRERPIPKSIRIGARRQVSPRSAAATVYNQEPVAVHGCDTPCRQMGVIAAVWRAAPVRT